MTKRTLENVHRIFHREMKIPLKFTWNISKSSN